MKAIQMESYGGADVLSYDEVPTPEQHGVKSAMITVQPNAAELKKVTALVEAGQLKTFVETVLPLSAARQAHDLSQSGRTRGKIVLQVMQ